MTGDCFWLVGGIVECQVIGLPRGVLGGYTWSVVNLVVCVR